MKPATLRIGVLLAAGRGRRMGSTKQLVPWPTAAGEIPLVVAAFEAIQPICDEFVVVLGHESDAVTVALGDRPFHEALSDPDAPMFESIRVGIRRALSFDPDATIVLHPADHPQVSHATLLTLTDWSLKRPVEAIIPEYDDRGGHPVLIPHNIAVIISGAECPDGLGQFWIDHPKLCHRVSVKDSGILRNIDTPSDLNN